MSRSDLIFFCAGEETSAVVGPIAAAADLTFLSIPNQSAGLAQVCGRRHENHGFVAHN